MKKSIKKQQRIGLLIIQIILYILLIYAVCHLIICCIVDSMPLWLVLLSVATIIIGLFELLRLWLRHLNKKYRK